MIKLKIVMSKQKITNNANLSDATLSTSKFVRMPQPSKRRSLAIHPTANEIADIIKNQQLRTKPAIEIYRPPSNNLLE